MVSASTEGPVFFYSSKPSTNFEVLGYLGMLNLCIIQSLHDDNYTSSHKVNNTNENQEFGGVDVFGVLLCLRWWWIHYFRKRRVIEVLVAEERGEFSLWVVCLSHDSTTGLNHTSFLVDKSQGAVQDGVRAE